MAMITRIDEKMIAASTPVINDWAITLWVPKKKVKQIVSAAPGYFTCQFAFWTLAS